MTPTTEFFEHGKTGMTERKVKPATKFNAKVYIDKHIWKRIKGWLIWTDISIHGDELRITIKFGNVTSAMKAFKYYTTGSNPH